MAVSFRSREPDDGFEVGEYRQISRSDPEAAAATPRSNQANEETQEDHCPRGWISSSSSCYYVSSQRASWDGARQDCRSRGGDLVVIDSLQEQDFLAALVVAAWVGMTDRDTEGVWMWVDGTPVDKERLRWAPGQPDDAFGGEDCGDLRVMTSFVGLNDFDCDFPAQWICEKNINLV